MSENEAFNRREEDKRWFEINERLVNLFSAQGSTDVDQAKIERRLAKLERVVFGAPEDNLEGLTETSHQHQTEINKFNAIFSPDHLGNGGLIHDINSLLDNRRRSDKREGYLWAFLTAVAVQFLILIGLIVVNWDKIQSYLVQREQSRQGVEIKRLKTAHRAKHEPANTTMPQ